MTFVSNKVLARARLTVEQKQCSRVICQWLRINTKSYWLAVEREGQRTMRRLWDLTRVINTGWVLHEESRGVGPHAVYTVRHTAKSSYCTRGPVLSVRAGKHSRRRPGISLSLALSPTPTHTHTPAPACVGWWQITIQYISVTWFCPLYMYINTHTCILKYVYTDKYRKLSKLTC